MTNFSTAQKIATVSVGKHITAVGVFAGTDEKGKTSVLVDGKLITGTLVSKVAQRETE